MACKPSITQMCFRTYSTCAGWARGSRRKRKALNRATQTRNPAATLVRQYAGCAYTTLSERTSLKLPHDKKRAVGCKCKVTSNRTQHEPLPNDLSNGKAGGSLSPSNPTGHILSSPKSPLMRFGQVLRVLVTSLTIPATVSHMVTQDVLF
jgi:hypothetical protein